MLFAFPEFKVHQIPFGAQIGKDRSEAINAFVGSGNAFLLCLRVVERAYIHIQGKKITGAGMDGRDRRRAGSDQIGARIFDRHIGPITDQIDSLAQGRTGWTCTDANGFVEKVLLLAKDFNGVEIGFSNTHQRNHRSQDIGMRNFGINTVDSGDRLETQFEIDRFKQCADMDQSAMAGQLFHFMFDHDRASQNFHLRSECLMPYLYHIIHIKSIYYGDLIIFCATD